MEFLSALSALIGGGIVWHINRSTHEAAAKKAYRAASCIETLELVEYELAKLDKEAKRDGCLSDKSCALMSALYGRWYELQRKL